MKAQMAFVLFLAAFFLVAPVLAVYHFPTDINLVGNVTYHFGDEYFSTTSSYATITAWFVDNWVNYTVSGAGTQTIYNGSKPLYVLIDGTQSTETNGWTYAGGVVTVTSATYAVCMSFDSVSVSPAVDTGTGGTGGSYQLIWIILLNGNMVDGADIKLIDAAYGWYVAELSTVDGQASQDLPSGTYNYTVTWKEFEVKGTLIHDCDETVSVDLATKHVSVSWHVGERIKVGLVVLTIFIGGVLIYGQVKKSGRKR